MLIPTRIKLNKSSKTLELGYADGLICGMTGQYSHHLGVIREIIGKRNGVSTMAAMNTLNKTSFILKLRLAKMYAPMDTKVTFRSIAMVDMNTLFIKKVGKGARFSA